jgi:hypothetical protein
MMSKKEKLNLIIDKVLTTCQEDSPITTMLKPILLNFIAQMKEDEVEKMIKVIKAIISYLEKEDDK